jgi:type II secretory pathway component PulK
MQRGFSLPGVLALCLFLSVLFVTLHSALSLNRQRLAQQKFQQSAIWLSVSGADLAQARLAKGQLKVGETLVSPQFKEGSFKVTSRRSGSAVQVESVGLAGGQTYTTKRMVGSR